jgi:hypothetical protein
MWGGGRQIFLAVLGRRGLLDEARCSWDAKTPSLEDAKGNLEVWNLKVKREPGGRVVGRARDLACGYPRLSVVISCVPGGFMPRRFAGRAAAARWR